MNVIDLAPLLAKISPDAPSGVTDLRSDAAFVELEILIKGTPAVYSGKEKIQEAQEPDWRKVKTAAVELLARGHDLHVAVILTRALLHTNGLAGLSTGLTLIHALIELYWETLYPRLDPDDDNDPTERSSILAQLSVESDILRPLKQIPLCASRVLGRYCYRDILIAGGKFKPEGNENRVQAQMAQIEAAFKETDPKVLSANQAAVSAACDMLARLQALLKDKIPDPGRRPDMNGLRQLLTGMDAFIQRRSAQEIGPEAATDDVAAPPPSVGSNNAVAPGEINDRQEVIRQLDRICSYYERNEPASPIPLLLKRARHLVDKNFLEIIQDLMPDSAKKIKSLISGTD